MFIFEFLLKSTIFIF